MPSIHVLVVLACGSDDPLVVPISDDSRWWYLRFDDGVWFRRFVIPMMLSVDVLVVPRPLENSSPLVDSDRVVWFR